MKKITILFSLLIFTTSSYSQNEDLVNTHSSSITNPKFDGGELDKFYTFINQEFDFSVIKKSGVMIVSFTINTEGALEKIKILEFNDIDSAKETIRVLNKSPKWESAKRDGTPIEFEIKMPIDLINHINPKATENNIQLPKTPISEKENLEIYNSGVIEKTPSFEGGMKSFYQYVATNYNVPDTKGFSGKVILSFVIEKDGSINDIKIIKDIGYGTGEEAIRILKKCPKWIPGEQNGKKVRTLYSLPISIGAK
jgi:Gram-negative bacterial TonB protein C-terminal